MENPNLLKLRRVTNDRKTQRGKTDSRKRNMIMKNKLKTLPALFAVLATAAYLCAGCMTGNPDRLHKRVNTWTPLGTAAEDAKRIMEGHGFTCRAPHRLEAAMPSDGPVLECRRTNHVINRTWVVRLVLQNNRVVGIEEQIFNDPLRMFNNMH